MRQLLSLFTILIGLTTSSVFAQEICNNGIDDDNDGFIDCFDGECAKNAACVGGYLGNDLNCEAKPSVFPKFSLALESASQNGTSTHLNRIVVGDVDRDGTPEIVATNQVSKKLTILNGENVNGVNTIQKQITLPFNPSFVDILVANIDNDNCAEIFVISTSWRIYAYDCNLNQIWSTQLPGDPGMMGLADFNGDGKVELYARNAIFNAHTGATIVAPPTTGDKWATVNGGPVAVDILNDVTKNAHTPTDAIKDDNLELVVGGIIYSVNISAGTIFAEKRLNNYGQKTASDATSIADFNADGSLDVLATGKWTSNTPDVGNTTVKDNTTIFFWDIKNNTSKTFSDAMPGDFTINACPDPKTGAYYKNGWGQGTGRINIADIDGDGKPNAAFVSGKFLYALKDDLTLLWRRVVNEETSGNTGCTLFDFNGDGHSEIVYRDEKFIYIIDGTDGSIFTQQPCVSRTNREYPIVADVDGDGNTELCVTCRTVDFVQNGTITDPNDPAYTIADKNNFCNDNNWQNGQVRVFRSAAEPWVPARRVWNQHGYFNVNVNDDLTIPKVQQKHHVIFSSNQCSAGDNRPLNSFLNQSPFLNSNGCPKYASPDITYVDNSLSIQQPTCPDGVFKVSFQVTNKGDLTMNGNMPITFYSGNPTTSAAVKLNTITLSLSNLKVGDVQGATDVSVSGPGSMFTLYIVLNDDGTTNVPITLPNTPTIECNYVNNLIHANVIPIPVAITAVKVQDDYKCSSASTPDNGAVRAYILKNGTENAIDYNFYWSIGTVAKPVASADFVGAIWTGRAAGTYTVYALHKTAGCSSDTARIVINVANRVLDSDISLVHAYDKCVPPNGAVRVIMNDGDGDGIGENPANFSYEWYAGNDIFTSPLLGINDTLSGVGPQAFTVLVKDKLSGCQTIESYTVPDQTIIPVVQATAVEATCTDPTSGSVTAAVNNTTTGYTFTWYNGSHVKTASDFIGASWTSRTQGSYTVVAKANASNCSSAAVVVAVGKSPNPVVTTTIISNQTSCDPAQPTGAAAAVVNGSTSGYTFEWFKGQNTLSSNKVASTGTATGLMNAIYTVKATNTTTGCSGVSEVTIQFAVVTPEITTSASVNPTLCSTPNGSIKMNVSLDSPTDYTFFWYNGDEVKGTTDYANTTQTLSGLSPGEYTVLAVNNIRHCKSQPVTVKLIDAAPVITFNLTNMVRPNTCSDASGLLSVNVSATGNTQGFTLEWRKGQEPYVAPAITTVSNTGNSTTVSSLISGAYTLIAINRDNGCSSTYTFDLPFDNAQVVTSVSTTNIQTCVPGTDGSLTINLLKTPGFDESDYSMYVYNGKNDLDAPASSAFNIPGVNGTADYVVSGSLAPGFYTVVAVTTNPARSTYNCHSVPITVELIKDTQKPSFTANPPVNNVNCSGATGSGEISVVLTAPTTNPADYTFNWFEGSTVSAPVLGTSTSGTVGGINGEVAGNLVAGEYTVVVTKTSGVNAGCKHTATYQIFEQLPVISLSAADISKADIDRCDMMTSGSITVNFVNEDGVQVTPANYDFEWYNDSPTGPQLIAGARSNVLSGRPAGKYYVRTINRTSNCSADGLIEMEILDNTMNTVTVELINFVIPTTCLKPVNVQGELEVIGEGTSTAGYTYAWFAGNTTSDPAVNAVNVTGANGEKVQGVLTGFYTIEVTNNTTQCRITDTYELPVDKRPVAVAASAEAMTVCFPSPKDGAVFATVTSGSKNDYAYNWYRGTVGASPDFTSDSNTPVSNLTPGIFIVIATDNMDATCFASDTVKVTDGRTPPIVTALSLSPLTICDPARPDGVASANVGGEYLNYTFDWYNNANASGTSFFSGPQASQLAAGNYSVIGTNVLTGCSDTTRVSIEINQLAIPVPQITVLSVVTSCIEGNGELTASVGGNTRDYSFDWYNGSQLKGTADFTGENYHEVSTGSYSVTATSRATGCVSNLVTTNVGELLIYPEFSWTTVAAMCMRDASEPSNGLAAIFMTDSISVGSIVWQTNGGTVDGPILSGVQSGIYQVTVTSMLGCATTKDVEIKPDIHPYNGISRRRDGSNDTFFINCIESFPMNSVKIFNRAGTLVYEAEGYDNAGTYFDGKSNKGISLMGNNLPDGTYFYIIDKHDGTRPIAGYLELVK